MPSAVPVIDLESSDAPELLDHACRTTGFFALRMSSAQRTARDRLLQLARCFFDLPLTEKAAVSLSAGGHAWRGWFPLGGELTSGVADQKEGFYFGRELAADPRPLHGPNVWPEHPEGLPAATTAWMEMMEDLGQRALACMSVGLGLDPRHLSTTLTTDPTVLFRIFRYPPHQPGTQDWGVAEHTDYGLLTLLAHDGTPGLQVHSGGHWVEVDPDPDLIVCNIGDMLDRLSSGRYRSTPHRVRNTSAHDRYSMPFFLDPGWAAEIVPLPVPSGWSAPADRTDRWDRVDLNTLTGTYGEWLQRKVRHVFPDLAAEVLDTSEHHDQSGSASR